MTARVLDYAEWDRLPDYMDPVLTQIRPGQSRMCVVENDQGEIVARWLLYPALLAEDLWIHPDYRKRVSVGRKLWRLVQSAARELGFSEMVSTVMTDDVSALVAHPSLRTGLLPPMVAYTVKGDQ